MWKLQEFYYFPKQNKIYNRKTPTRNSTAINNQSSQHRNIAGSFTELYFATQRMSKACYSQSTGIPGVLPSDRHPVQRESTADMWNSSGDIGHSEAPVASFLVWHERPAGITNNIVINTTVVYN
jgi:hypothetical protein